jgi:hypothetical protein
LQHVTRPLSVATALASGTCAILVFWNSCCTAGQEIPQQRLNVCATCNQATLLLLPQQVAHVFWTFCCTAVKKFPNEGWICLQHVTRPLCCYCLSIWHRSHIGILNVLLHSWSRNSPTKAECVCNL